MTFLAVTFLAVTFFAVALFAVALFAVALFAVALFAVALFAVALFAVVFFAVALFAVTFFAVTFFAVVFFAVALFAVALFAVALFAVALLAVALFTVVFLPVAFFVGTVYLPSDVVLSCPVITSLKGLSGQEARIYTNFPHVPDPVQLVPASVVRSVYAAYQFAILALFRVAAAALVVRYRRSRGEERLQVKWVAFAATLTGVPRVEMEDALGPLR